jgi:hypothetical protein
MSKKGIVGFGLLVLIVGSACGLPSLGGASGSGGAETPTPTPTEAPLVPVSINQGLASLDSYRMTFTNEVFDSVAQERTTITFVVASDRDTDASFTRSETLVTAEGGEVVSEDVEEQFVIGNQLCSVTDGEAEFTVISDTAQVMTNLMSQVVDFNPLIENPVYVGEDVVNGVPVRTYTFEVRSIGAASGVEADRADGSYAIAIDGDYLVDYRLDLKLRTGIEGDPEAQSTVSFFDLSLEEINQPVAIAFPANCQEAQSSAE